MREIHIGEMIKQRRMELGLTQWDLCEGICDPATLSRIESGKNTPSRSRLNALLQRLGLPGEKFYAMMSENELEVERLKDEIINFNACRCYGEALEKIEELSRLAEEDDHLTRQFILRSRVLAGKMEQGEVIPYSFEEKIQLLLEAIRLTIPSFDVDKIGSHWYSRDEMKIINQIGIVYGDNQKNEQAIHIYEQLVEVLGWRFMDNLETCGVISLIYYNYCLYLCRVGRYEESMTIAHKGWDHATFWRKSSNLGGFLWAIAESHYRLGHSEESKKYYLQCYYTYLSTKEKDNAEIMRENIKEYFNIEM